MPNFTTELFNRAIDPESGPSCVRKPIYANKRFKTRGVLVRRMKNMRLSLGTNFDNDLLEQIADTKVKVVYGKLPQDIFGGGRPTISLPEVTKDHLINHIKLAHSLGKEFNYLLNTNCMDNLEFRSDINKEIYEFIAWLDEIGVDWITVSIPYFIPVIKHIAPRIKVSLSV